jgi:RND family efflux transporter MFP subunit
MAEVRRIGAASHRPERRGRWDATAAWQAFRTARSVADFYRGWLGVQCQLVAAAGGAAFATGGEGACAPSPLSAWGDVRATLPALGEAARQALARRERVVVPNDTAEGRRFAVALPIQAEGRVLGAVALDLAARPAPELESALRQLEWGCGWLEALALRETRARACPPAHRRLQDVLDLAASAQGHERFLAAATAFVTELATRLACDRVSIGFLVAGRVRVRVVSHTAHLGERSNLLRAIAAAMDEAVDQQSPVVFPEPAGLPRVCRAHEELARQGSGGSLCTVPFASGERLAGALTLERTRERPFEPGEIALVEAVAGLAGPGLESLRREDRWLPAKALDSARRTLEDLLGPGRVRLKLGAALALAAVVFLTCAKGELRVSAPATMEGVVRRAAVAPFDGYLREAPVRAGDVVHEGQVLAVLDDRELRLERARLESQRDQLERQRALALAQGLAAQTNIARAQIDQVLARIALIDDQLARTRVVAGFDGVVVMGDLSQALGSPVEQGEVLFEIAPLDAYRLVLEVDERDVAQVAEGQRGKLVLVAEPGEALPFAVEKIVPVSDARDGRNFFRVEARLERTPERLRPGMEGVAKIEVGRRRLAAIWTRSAVDWARLALWTWAP